MNKLNLRSYFKKYAFLYFIAIIAMLGGTMLDMVFPIVVQHIVDDVLIGKALDLVNKLLLCILAIGVGRLFFQYIKEFLCDYCGSKIACEIRIDLFRKIQSLSANFFDGINSGELMSRVKDDVDHIWDVGTFMAILMAEVVVRTASAMFFMVRINWQLSILPIIGMILTGIIALKMEGKLDVLFGDVEQENSELNNTAAENLAGVRTVKAFAREGYEINKFHKHNQKFYDLNIDLSRVFVKYNPKIQVITRLLSTITCLLGGLMVIKGKKITVGELMALLGYVGGLVWPIEMIGWLTNGFSRAKASLRRINQIYSQVPDIKDESLLSPKQNEQTVLPDALFTKDDLSGEISFEHVTYKIGEREILKDVSFSFGAGKTLGIMGATGSGKTQTNV